MGNRRSIRQVRRAVREGDLWPAQGTRAGRPQQADVRLRSKNPEAQSGAEGWSSPSRHSGSHKTYRPPEMVNPEKPWRAHQRRTGEPARQRSKQGPWFPRTSRVPSNQGDEVQQRGDAIGGIHQSQAISLHSCRLKFAVERISLLRQSEEGSGLQQHECRGLSGPGVPMASRHLVTSPPARCPLWHPRGPASIAGRDGSFLAPAPDRPAEDKTTPSHYTGRTNQAEPRSPS